MLRGLAMIPLRHGMMLKIVMIASTSRKRWLLCSASKHRVTRLLYCLEMNLWTCRDSDDGENSVDVQRMYITVEHPFVQLLHCLAMDVLRPVATLTMVVMAAPFKDSSGMCGTSKHPFAHLLHCLAMDL